MISSPNDRSVEAGVRFLVGALWFHDLREEDAVKVATAMASVSPHSNPKVRQAIAKVFHISAPPTTIPIVFGFMNQLAKDKEEQVGQSALRNLGNLEYQAPPYVQDEIWGILVNAWKTETQPDIRAAALHSLKNFADSSESDTRRRELSAIVADALNIQDREVRHSAVWVVGGLTFGFRPVAEFNNVIFTRLLSIYRTDRSMPRSWYLTAFENLTGELPNWAQEQLARDEQQERDRRLEGLQFERHLEQRRRKEKD